MTKHCSQALLLSAPMGTDLSGCHGGIILGQPFLWLSWLSDELNDAVNIRCNTTLQLLRDHIESGPACRGEPSSSRGVQQPGSHFRA